MPRPQELDHKNKKRPLLVPLLEPVGPHAPLRRGGSLLPWSAVSQYSTAKAISPAGHGNGPNASGRQQESGADASGLHAGGLDVKPYGTRHNRTSSAASGDPARSARSTQDGNSRFFRNPPPPDGPRPPRAEIIPPPDACAHAPDSGRIARVDAPCPARWPDTAGPPDAATRGGPLPHTPRYSTAKEDEAERTTSRTPSEDKSAHDNAWGLASALMNDHAEPRTQGAPTPEGQVPAAEPPLRSGAFWTAHLLLVQPRSSLITPLPSFHPFPGMAPTRPPANRHESARALAPTVPRNWPPVSPRLTKKTQAFIDEQTRLHVFHLPSYSPDWNPDEKVWNHLKHQELKSHQAKTKDQLKTLSRKKLRAMSRNPSLMRGIFYRCCVADLFG